MGLQIKQPDLRTRCGGRRRSSWCRRCRRERRIRVGFRWPGRPGQIAWRSCRRCWRGRGGGSWRSGSSEMAGTGAPSASACCLTPPSERTNPKERDGDGIWRERETLLYRAAGFRVLESRRYYWPGPFTSPYLNAQHGNRWVERSLVWACIPGNF